MTVLAAETARKRRRIEDMESEKYPMTNVKIWKGAIVALNTSGYATNGADTASFVTLGIAAETVDNAAGSAGDKSINVEWGHWELMDSTGVDATNEGAAAVISDNNVVTDAAAGTNDIRVGEIVKYAGSNKAWVAIRRYA